jgi:hypothetical protein
MPAYHSDMSRKILELPGSNPSDHLIAADLILREEPDEEEDEEDNQKNDDGDGDEDQGYSE